MLSQLSIKNFGLIDQITLEFDKGLNILTGETGAGKSIIIDALRIVLGERMSSSYVRNPEKSCILEAVFDLSGNELRERALLQDFLSEDDASLIIHRAFLSDGRGKIKINGSSITIGQLKEIGNSLIDFHGPHDHQMLLSSEAHSTILDRLIDFGGLLKEYQKVYSGYHELKKKMDQLKALAQSRERELDLLSHQIKELDQVPLDEQQYEQLIQEQAKLTNAERLTDCASKLIGLLEGEQDGASEKIRQSFSYMTTLNQTDAQTAPLMDCLAQLQDINDQLLIDLRNYAEGLCFEPHQAQEISQKIDLYEDIRRKFGPSLCDAQKFYAQAKEKYDLLSDLEHQDSKLQTTIEQTEKELRQLAQKITIQRKNTSSGLKKTIEKELRELGIAHVKFESRVEPGDLNGRGQDKVTFYISPNAGEALKPLSEIVSSGEAARVMLALKKALIKVDPIPVLIFDEIDAQIGGRLGTITGQKLKEISQSRQVLLITHLPQIASFADIHLKVEKTVKENRARTTVQTLNKESRVKELAEMMSGETESRISIKHASDMLANASS